METSEARIHGDQPAGGGPKNKYAFGCAIVASTISILMGYDTGVMSGAMLFMKEDLKIKDEQVQVLAGIMNICALVGSLTAGRLSDWIGRRFTIVIASIIFFAGAVLMGVGLNYAMVFSGRCVAGVGVGYALMVAPVYSAEIASTSTRGLLTSLPELCISFGILLGYVANYGLGKLSLRYGWRLMLGLAALPSLAVSFGVIAMPESPRWLVMQGRVKAAKDVLLRISGSGAEAERRLQEIKAAAGVAGDGDADPPPSSSAGRGGKGVWREMFLRPSQPVRRIMVAAIGIHFFEHATGIEAVVLYTPRIFKKAGISGQSKLLFMTMGVGVIKTTFIVLATVLMDKVGRRRLLLSSVAGMVLSLSALGMGLTVIDQSDHRLRWAIVLCVAGLLLFVAFFSIGLGPVTWVYSSEIFPLRLRAQGSSVGVAVNRLMNGVVSMSFISLYEAITIGGAFFMFAGLSITAWLFFYFCCPETKGRSLEEMEEVFGKGWRERRKAAVRGGGGVEIKLAGAAGRGSSSDGGDHANLV